MRRFHKVVLVNSESGYKGDRSQYANHIDKTIHRSLMLLTAYAAYSVVMLLRPDKSLIVAEEAVTLPLVNTQVDYVQFLLVGQLILLCVTAYLHVHIHAASGIPSDIDRLPYLRNHRFWLARLMFCFLAYVVPPGLAIWFAWKTLPIKVSIITLPIALCFVVVMIWIVLPRKETISHYLLRVVILTVVVFVLWKDSDRWNSIVNDPKETFTSRDILSVYMIDNEPNNPWLWRGLNLRGVDLNNMDLNYRNLKDFVLAGAMLGNTDLRSSNLQGVDFSNATLTTKLDSAFFDSETNFVGAKDPLKENLTKARNWRTLKLVDSSLLKQLEGQ